MTYWIIGYLAVGILVPAFIMLTHQDELAKILGRVPKEYRALVIVLSLTVSAIFWPALFVESLISGRR